MAINRYAGLAQLVEHLICNQGVGGSNPSAGTIQKAEAPNPDRPGSHSKPPFEPPTRQSVRTEPQASSLERSESHPSTGTIRAGCGQCQNVISLRFAWPNPR